MHNIVNDRFFKSYKLPDYARAGCVATSTVILPEGLLSQFSHTIEPYMRKLGLPVELRKGVPALIKEYKVCKNKEVLTSDKAKILVS